MKLIQSIIPLAVAIAMTSCATNTPSTSASVKPYPLETCIVSGEDLDSMGGEITRVYEGQEVKFCCKGCVKDFDKSPATYLSKL